MIPRQTLAVAAVFCLLAGASQAQMHGSHETTGSGMMSGHAATGGEANSMGSMCQQMMQGMREMQDKQRQMDQDLQQLLERMNSATGEAKTAVMGQVVTKLVEQRRQMNEMAFDRHEKMMKHMGDHMKGGMGSMMQCPMMQGGGTAGTSGGGSGSSGASTSSATQDHSGHH